MAIIMRRALATLSTVYKTHINDVGFISYSAFWVVVLLSLTASPIRSARVFILSSLTESNLCSSVSLPSSIRVRVRTFPLTLYLYTTSPLVLGLVNVNLLPFTVYSPVKFTVDKYESYVPSS